LSGRNASIRCRIIGCPAISCKTFGVAELRRVPSPAARMMAAKRASFMIRLAQRPTGNETRSSAEGLHDPRRLPTHRLLRIITAAEHLRPDDEFSAALRSRRHADRYRTGFGECA